MNEISEEMQKSKNKIILHGFSVGGFGVAALTLNLSDANKKLENVVGVVWDSLVMGNQSDPETYEKYMKNGLVKSTPPLIQ